MGEAVHRNWLFVNSHGVAFTLDAQDATQPANVQRVDDSILATFRPADAATGCAGG